MEKEERKQFIEELITELKNKGFIRKQKRPKAVTDAIKATKAKKDVYLKNEETLQQWTIQGVFNKPAYDFPEEGPYDYRYLIDHGKELSPTKAMLAMYWREKTTYTKLGKEYSFPTKGMAGAMIVNETRDAQRLASAIEFKDFKKLVALVDDKYSEMFKTRGGFEWKLKNLVENIDLLN